MNHSLSKLALLFPIALLSACKTDISPEWETHYSHAQTPEESRVQWLGNIAVDSYGDIISGGTTIVTGGNREQNVLFVKQDSNGQRLWAVDYDLGDGTYRSDEKVTDLVLDAQGNTYAVGTRYIVENGEQSYGSFLLKVDMDGGLEWVRELSIHEDARDIEIKHDQLYVTGFATQVFDFDGVQQLSIAHDKAWDIEVDDLGNMYVVGYSAAQKYDANGGLIWSTPLQEDLYHQASIAVNQDGSVVIAHNQQDRSTRVSGIDATGQMTWSRVYQEARSSNGLPGPALLKTDWRGDSILTLSNDRGRRIVKLDEYGQEQWQTTSQGIVQDFALNNDGSIFVVGSGVNEKYDADGTLLASTETTANAQITTGSIALDGDQMYVGYSAIKDGDIQLYLAKFLDQ